MNAIQEAWGLPMSAKEVAAAVGVATRTVQRYPERFGGVHNGDRWLFFDKRVMEALMGGTDEGGGASRPMREPSPKGRPAPKAAGRRQVRKGGAVDEPREKYPNRHGLAIIDSDE